MRENVDNNNVHFKAVFEKSTLGIVIENKEGQLLKINPAFQKFLGYREEELLGCSWTNFTYPGDIDSDWQQYGS